MLGSYPSLWWIGCWGCWVGCWWLHNASTTPGGETNNIVSNCFQLFLTVSSFSHTIVTQPWLNNNRNWNWTTSLKSFQSRVCCWCASCCSSYTTSTTISPHATDWTAKKPNPADASLWQVDWDTDETQQDDFGKQLAEELTRAKEEKQQG